MKVCSVNLCPGSNHNVDRKIERNIQNERALALHKLCLQLDAPNEEFYRLFDQLRSSNITKNPQQEIAVAPGGVIGDRHYSAPIIQNVDDNFYKLTPQRQISVLSKERYCELNKLNGKNIQAGQYGENIQTEGLISMELMSKGTILQFGDTAQIEVTFLRTFCYKFAMVLRPDPLEYFYHRKTSANPLIRRIGITGQVIKSGFIKPNDSITVIYTPADHVSLEYFDPMVDGVAIIAPYDPLTTT